MSKRCLKTREIRFRSRNGLLDNTFLDRLESLLSPLHANLKRSGYSRPEERYFSKEGFYFVVLTELANEKVVKNCLEDQEKVNII